MKRHIRKAHHLWLDIGRHFIDTTEQHRDLIIQTIHRCFGKPDANDGYVGNVFICI